MNSQLPFRSRSLTGIAPILVLVMVIGSLSRGQVRPGASSVYGAVTDPKGLPVSGVSVKSGKVQTTTYRDGRYLLQGVEVGETTVKFSKDSYKSVSRRISIKRGELVELNIGDFESLVEARPRSNALGLPLNQVTMAGSYLFASAAPDGRTLAAELLDKGTHGYDIWLLSDAGEKLRPLSQLPDDESNPSWSPRGGAIVFSAYSSRFGYRIFVGRVEAGQEAELVEYGITPTWSPDGEWIVYAKSERTGVWEIWKKNLTTKEAMPLTAHGVRAQYPCWGRTGDREFIVYATSTGSPTGTYELWKMSPDGMNQEQLTSAGLNFIGPAISPDGEMIACWSLQRGKPNSVWIMRSDGSDQRKLVDNAANPQWLNDETLLISAKISGGPQLWKTRIR